MALRVNSCNRNTRPKYIGLAGSVSPCMSLSEVFLKLDKNEKFFENITLF